MLKLRLRGKSKEPKTNTRLFRLERLVVARCRWSQLAAWCRAGCTRPACLLCTTQQSTRKSFGFAGRRTQSILSSVWEKYEGDWEQKLHAHTLSYNRAKVYTTERLDLERICAALPPAGVGGLVEALDVSTGFVRDALLDPSLVLKPNVQEDERPRDPTIWASDADGQELAVFLVGGNICELIEFNDIADANGRKVLGGLMGVAKAGNDRDTGPQRLIMNIKVSNWAQNVIAGDMPQLPNSQPVDNGGVWSWRMGKLWFGPEKISNAVSTCSKFPKRGANGWPLQPPWPVVVFILAALVKSTSARKLSPRGGFLPPESSNTSTVGC